MDHQPSRQAAARALVVDDLRCAIQAKPSARVRQEVVMDDGVSQLALANARRSSNIAAAADDGRVVLMVPTGAALVQLLPAVEELLLAVAAAEASEHHNVEGLGFRLPAPLAGRVALAALYRVWDLLGAQLHPLGPDGPQSPQLVRLPAADLNLLTAAAEALRHPTPDLAALLDHVRTRHRDPAALARLLAVLRPTVDTAEPMARPAS